MFCVRWCFFVCVFFRDVLFCSVFGVRVWEFFRYFRYVTQFSFIWLNVLFACVMYLCFVCLYAFCCALLYCSVSDVCVKKRLKDVVLFVFLLLNVFLACFRYMLFVCFSVLGGLCVWVILSALNRSYPIPKGWMLFVCSLCLFCVPLCFMLCAIVLLSLRCVCSETKF